MEFNIVYVCYVFIFLTFCTHIRQTFITTFVIQKHNNSHRYFPILLNEITKQMVH
jgi:hypothetical protein